MAKGEWEDMAKSTAMGAADGAIGQGMGLIFGGIQDRRQRRQQEKLNEINLASNKKMLDYSKAKDLQMWNDTNAEAQMKHYREAGLNPAMMYGGSGAGGSATTGGGSQSVGGGQADGASAGVGMGIQLASQIALMKAQKENIEADTENKKSAVPVNTTKAEGQTIANEIAGATKDAEIDRIQTEAKNAVVKLEQDTINKVVSEETAKERIQGIKEEMAGEALKNLLTKANIKLSKSKVWEIAEKVAQGWKAIEFQGTDKVLGKYIEQVADMVKGLGGGTEATPNRKEN